MTNTEIVLMGLLVIAVIVIVIDNVRFQHLRKMNDLNLLELEDSEKTRVSLQQAVTQERARILSLETQIRDLKQWHEREITTFRDTSNLSLKDLKKKYDAKVADCDAVNASFKETVNDYNKLKTVSLELSYEKEELQKQLRICRNDANKVANDLVEAMKPKPKISTKTSRKK